jgi:hypothetical protein
LLSRAQPLIGARILVVVLVSVFLAGTIFSGVGPAAAAPPGATLTDWDIAGGGHFFTQTGGEPGTGFTVTDADGIGFWQEYRRQGGLDSFGYPTSNRFQWRGFVTQAFQRAILQWHPDDQHAYALNVLDLLHDVGKDDWLATKGVPRPVDAASFDAGKNWQGIVAARTALLDANPAFKERYQSTPDAINLYGLPTSPVVDAGDFYVARLQRAVMQQWKKDVPWAKTGQVTVALAGDLAKEAGLIDAADIWVAESGDGLLPRWGWQVASGVVPEGERWIDVSLSDQSITAMVGSKRVFCAPATTGKKTFPTPVGVFYIYTRVYNETMDSLTIGIPHESPEGYLLKNIYFTQYFLPGGYAIHANYWQPEAVFGAWPTSHGCVGMHYDDAKFFWDFATIGTKIVVHT